MANSTPIPTSWNVITGGASAGKTSLCVALSALGHSVIPEAARLLMDHKISEGLSMAEIRKDNLALQREILKHKIAYENLRSPQMPIFIDRGIPDSCAYGLPRPEVVAGHRFQYRNVFFLQSVGFQNDYARVESEAEAIRMAETIYKAYVDFGYRPIIVPKIPLQERIAFVLDRASL